MPDRGLLERSTIAAVALGGRLPAPWTLTGARWAQITYEVGQQAALGRLPSEATRPVPCYARLLVLEADGSSAGPLRLAALTTGGRYQLMAKNVLTDVLVDGPAADFSATFGGPCREGTVSILRHGDAVTCTVADSGDHLATLTLPALRSVDPAMLRWDPWLGFAAGDSSVKLVEVGFQPELAVAFLSKGAALETPTTLPRTHLWRSYRNLNTISACYAEGSVVLAAPVAQHGA